MVKVFISVTVVIEAGAIEICYTHTLERRHNERDAVSNHRRLYSLSNRLFRR